MLSAGSHRMSETRLQRWLGPAAALLISLNGLACAPTLRQAGQDPAAQRAKGPLRPVAISNADFAPNLQKLLQGQPSGQDYQNLLAGLVQFQLRRSAERFAAGKSEAAIATLGGALFLIRSGELRPEMLHGGAAALRDGSEEAARLGNEGYAIALYTMLVSILPAGPERQDAEQHLEALRQWRTARQSSGPLQALGADQRAAMNRALLESSDAALDVATKTTVAWMRRALESNVGEMPIRTSFEREEALEAYRAIRAGSAELVALYLRHGQPGMAVQVLEQADLLRVVPAGLRDRLERVAEDDDPGAWRDLHQTYSSAEPGDETSLSPELARAATWGSALGFYRSQPNNLLAAMALGQLSVDYGFGEVTPLLLSGALGEKVGPRELSVAMAMVLRAILAEDEAGDLEAARRTYTAALPIVQLAKKAGRTIPSPARVAYVMGALEARGGKLSNAGQLLQEAAREEPTVEVLMLLSSVERQAGRYEQALRALDQVLALVKAAGDGGTELEALLAKFEIYRDAGNTTAAEATLRAALGRALDVRQVAAANAEQARAERLLARVLEHYGDLQGARRTTQRAYEASRSDARQLTATVLDASRRALTRGDLLAGRDAVRRAIDANLEPEDMIYATLWLQLLERRLKVQADGTAEAAYAQLDDAEGWVAKLRAWGRGKLADEQLLKSAKNTIEATEAKFYTAMSHFVRGQREQALAGLREVAKSSAIELVEVAIARDLVAEQATPKANFTLPADVRVP